MKTIFSFGQNPVGVQVMTVVEELNFEDRYSLSMIFDADDLPIQMIHINHFVEAKKASCRLKDVDDINRF